MASLRLRRHLAWLLATLTVLVAASALAQEVGSGKKLGLGLAGGYYTNDFTVKYYLSPTSAVQAFVGGYNFEGAGFAADYVVEKWDLTKIDAGRLFFGAGGGADFWSWGDYSALGIHAVLELGWHFKEFPLEIVADWRPSFFFGDFAGFGERGGHGAIRWYF
jgi:hypothetical protein